MPPALYLPRHLDRPLAAAIASVPIVVLDGPRAVGKTTSARRLSASALFLPNDLDRLQADPVGFLQSLARPVLIDEWQLGGVELLWTLKQIVDSDPRPGQFVLTGSVEPATYGPTYPLTGRAQRLILRPMTIAEMEGRGAATTLLEHVAIGIPPEMSSGRPRGFDVEWLLRPGFPAARLMSDSRLFLESYANLVAQRAGEEGRDATRLLTTMRVLATLEAQSTPDQRIWESADVNKATWKAYEDLLTRTHVGSPIRAFSSNRLKRLTSYPKRYLADVSLALALAGVDAHQLRAEPKVMGHYLESFVVQQLRPQADLLRAPMSHLRTGAGEREVDIIVEVGDRIVAFEVKNSTRPRPTDGAGLAWLRDQLGDRFHAGFVVHTGGDTYPMGERISALSIEVLAGLAD